MANEPIVNESRDRLIASIPALFLLLLIFVLSVLMLLFGAPVIQKPVEEDIVLDPQDGEGSELAVGIAEELREAMNPELDSESRDLTTLDREDSDDKLPPLEPGQSYKNVSAHKGIEGVEVKPGTEVEESDATSTEKTLSFDELRREAEDLTR